jgi:hypothetical protein
VLYVFHPLVVEEEDLMALYVVLMEVLVVEVPMVVVEERETFLM